MLDYRVTASRANRQERGSQQLVGKASEGKQSQCTAIAAAVAISFVYSIARADIFTHIEISSICALYSIDVADALSHVQVSST